MAILPDDPVVYWTPGNPERRAYFDTLEEGYIYAEHKNYNVLRYGIHGMQTQLKKYQFVYLNKTIKEKYGYFSRP